MTVAVRPADESDVAACSRILCDSIKQLCGADHDGDPTLIAKWTANKTPQHVERMLSNPDLEVVVATVDGRPAAVGALRKDGEILLNYVAPSHRFQGFSRALLEFMESECRRWGLDEACLGSTETAHEFYKDAGWEDSGPPDTWLGMKSYPMRKLL